jgi:hypothetical protein
VSDAPREAERIRWKAEPEQIRATIANLNAETAKIRQETRFPSVVVAAFVVALVGPWSIGLVARRPP